MNKMQMKNQIDTLIKKNRERGETDNITALLVKAY
jgi:serine/threonine protein phosphatase PrpC